MLWKVSNPMDERLKFFSRALDGERMTELCQQLGISRKTAYKILGRYKDCGPEALTDRSPQRFQKNETVKSLPIPTPFSRPMLTPLSLPFRRLAPVGPQEPPARRCVSL